MPDAEMEPSVFNRKLPVESVRIVQTQRSDRGQQPESPAHGILKVPDRHILEFSVQVARIPE